MINFFSKTDWCLIADGSKALIFVNKGTISNPNLIVQRVFNQENPPNREQTSDRPGRMYDYSKHHKSAMEITDFHQRNEDSFMKKIAIELHNSLKEGHFKRLIIAAPPVALGVLRQELSEDLKNTIVREFNKDWTKIPASEIAEVVSKSLESRYPLPP